MEPPQKGHANLFQVYLRLRPPQAGNSGAERFLLVEDPVEHDAPTHITLNPPNDRRRAIEKFAFTRVFEEDATQLDLFQGIGVLPLVEGVLAPHGGDGTDGLLATLGVTGSGKTHTMLGSRSQRGLTQLALDVVFRSVESNIVDCESSPALETSIRSSDASEAAICSAPAFIDTMYTDFSSSRGGSRATTPMIVGPPSVPIQPPTRIPTPLPPGCFPSSPQSIRLVSHDDDLSRIILLSTPPSEKGEVVPTLTQVASIKLKPKLACSPSPQKHYMSLTSAARNKKNVTKCPMKGDHAPPTPRKNLQRPSAFPQAPDINSVRASCDPSAEYAIVISMYEVYNDRIFDLLTPPIRSNSNKEPRRRPLLFKFTELSPDRKVVAGLRKVICGNLKEALMVLEAGLHERRVAGTGSNSVSSRSHGFFCIEVKKRRRGRHNARWGNSTLSIVDLAGSERARDAKTQGATLAEAVPFRQCKLTELLFANSFPSGSPSSSTNGRRAPQKGVMIVTADPLGDFNATSQILRYSALAREVTVPRVPSITSTMLANANSSAHSVRSESSVGSRSDTSSPVLTHRRPYFHPSGNHSRMFSPAPDTERATMENAALEIARMADMIDQLNTELVQETEARMAAEAHLLSMEERLADFEQEIREECYADFEQRLALEMGRWKATLSLEQERGEEHWDRKVEVLARGVGVTVTMPSSDEDNVEDEDKENILIENLEQENERLRREVAILKRELSGRTPSKRAPLQERGDVPSTRASPSGADTLGDLGNRMEQLRVNSGESKKTLKVSSSGSPTKKVRKLQTRRWEGTAVDDDLM